MDLLDIFLCIIYSLTTIGGAWIYLKLRTPSDAHSILIPALVVKIVGSIAFYLTYLYYFKVGDTFVYLYDARILAEELVNNPIIGLKILFQSAGTFDPDTFTVTNQMNYFKGTSELIIVKIASLVSIFSLQQPLTTTLLFSNLSFIGIWKFYLFFYDQYPKLKMQLAIATLFIPSVVFWGSGVMKDTVILGFIGILLYYTNQFFKYEKRSFKNLFLIFSSLYLISITKAYVSIALVPALFYWILFTFNKRIENPVFKIFIIPLLLGCLIGISILILNQIESVSNKYSIDNLMTTAEVYQDYHYASGDLEQEGRRSSYSLGDYDPTLFGIIQMFPAAVNVTLFRPYIWEIRSPAMILSALESTFFIFFTLYIFFAVGIANTLKLILQNNLLLFCLVFSIFFAFAVGFSSYNFGALVRYKTPCMGFYLSFLFILNYETKLLKNKRITIPSHKMKSSR